MEIKSPFDLLTIQATSLCNLNCSYCYLPDRKINSTFDLSLIPFLFKNLEASNLINSKFTISWHAGEPFVLKPSFYKEAFEIINKCKPSNCAITHAVQTNGTLITQEYCNLIKEYDIKVGVSIDGPDFIHDRNRKNWAGNGTLEQTLKGIELLNKNNIYFNAIVVLTDYSLDFPNEIFDFFAKINCKGIGFNIEEIEGINNKSSFSNKLLETKYKKFFSTIFKLSKENKPTMIIREYRKIANLILNKEGVIKNGVVTPLNSITVDTIGNYTVFSPELLTVRHKDYDNFIFGNVKTDLFSDLFKNIKFQKVYSEILSGVELCKNSCSYFGICGGGTPSNKLHENGTFNSAETMCCKYIRKYLADVIIEDLEQVQN